MKKYNELTQEEKEKLKNYYLARIEMHTNPTTFNQRVKHVISITVTFTVALLAIFFTAYMVNNIFVTTSAVIIVTVLALFTKLNLVPLYKKANDELLEKETYIHTCFDIKSVYKDIFKIDENNKGDMNELKIMRSYLEPNMTLKNKKFKKE